MSQASIVLPPDFGARMTTATRRVAEQMKTVSANMERSVEQFQVAAERVRFSRKLRRERRLAGLESRYWVRAGLDPAYVSFARLVDLLAAVRWRTTGDEVDDMPNADRRRVAEAAIRGWAESRSNVLVGELLQRHVLDVWAEEAP